MEDAVESGSKERVLTPASLKADCCWCDCYQAVSQSAEGRLIRSEDLAKLPLSIRTHPSLTLARYFRSISQSTQSRGTTHVATLGDLVTYLAHIARVR